MSSRTVSHRRPWKAWAPFGVGQVKPKHLRNMGKDKGGSVPNYNARVRIEVSR